VEQILANLTYGRCVMINVALSALYFFLMYNDGSSLTTTITQMQSDISTKQARINTIEKAKKDADRYAETVKQLGAEMEKISQAIPKDFTGIELLKIVSTIARTVGVSINKLADNSSQNSYAATTTQDLIYDNVSVDVDISGTYNQIMTFLSALTQTDRLLVVKNLKLTSNATVGQLPTVVLNGSVYGYKFVEPVKKEETTQ
jgi:Tfp pilus assembly protein PilO